MIYCHNIDSSVITHTYEGESETEEERQKVGTARIITGAIASCKYVNLGENAIFAHRLKNTSKRLQFWYSPESKSKLSLHKVKQTGMSDMHIRTL